MIAQKGDSGWKKHVLPENNFPCDQAEDVDKKQTETEVIDALVWNKPACNLIIKMSTFSIFFLFCNSFKS